MTKNNPPQANDTHAEGLSESIAQLRRAMRRAARIADPENTLAVAQLELLSALIENPGIRPGNLARLLNLRPNTVTTIVNALYEKDMVSRTTAGEDRRAVELHATEAGRRAVTRWRAVNTAILGQALSALSAPQRHLLISAIPSLNAITKALEALDTKNKA